MGTRRSALFGAVAGFADGDFIPLPLHAAEILPKNKLEHKT
jgi:hypothetical protein